MKFVAIDFETTETSGKTICAVGIVKPDSPVFYTLVKPPVGTYWDPMCSAWHGITEDMVANSPSLPSIWEEILKYIGDAVLVAHCAKAVERHALLKNAAANGLTCPGFSMLCSMVLSKRAFPELSSHSLPIVANHIGHAFQHHHAGADAEACLIITTRCRDILGDDYLQGLIFNINDLSGKRYYSPNAIPRSERQRLCAEILQRLPQPCGQLEGVNFAFTGKLPIERKEAVSIVTRFGGMAKDNGNLTRETDFLVMGEKEYNDYHAGIDTHSKVRKVRSFIESGKNVGILSYQDFLDMVFD